MASLAYLAKADVTDVISAVLGKYRHDGKSVSEAVDTLIGCFAECLKEIYDCKDYKGDWKNDEVVKSKDRCIKATDALYNDFKTKKIVHISGASLSTIGGILALTPLAPIGWSMMAAGCVTTAVTDVIDVADKSLQKSWKKAKDELKELVENPFKGDDFEKIHKSLMKCWESLEGKLALDDFPVVLQGIGWNYFNARKEGLSHTKAMAHLKEVLHWFWQKRIKISDKMKLKDKDTIKDVQLNFGAIEGGKLKGTQVQVGALVMFGFCAGISFLTITSGMKLIGSSIKFLSVLGKFFMTMGKWLGQMARFVAKIGPAIAILAGLAVIVMDAVALANIDDHFKPYYDFADACMEHLKFNEAEYNKNSPALVEMFKYLNSDKAELEQVN